MLKIVTLIPTIAEVRLLITHIHYIIFEGVICKQNHLKLMQIPRMAEDHLNSVAFKSFVAPVTRVLDY